MLQYVTVLIINYEYQRYNEDFRKQIKKKTHTHTETNKQTKNKQNNTK